MSAWPVLGAAWCYVPLFALEKSVVIREAWPAQKCTLRSRAQKHVMTDWPSQKPTAEDNLFDHIAAESPGLAVGDQPGASE